MKKKIVLVSLALLMIFGSSNAFADYIYNFTFTGHISYIDSWYFFHSPDPWGQYVSVGDPFAGYLWFSDVLDPIFNLPAEGGYSIQVNDLVVENQYFPIYYRFDFSSTGREVYLTDECPGVTSRPPILYNFLENVDLYISADSKSGWFNMFWSYNIAGPDSSNLGGSIDNMSWTRIGDVPEPSTLLLLGAGLAGVGIMRRKLRK